MMHFNYTKDNISGDIEQFLRKVTADILAAAEKEVKTVTIPSFTFNSLPKPENAPKVTFSAVAFSKIMYLVEKTQSEIGWYMLTERLSDYEFLIKDIIVFPQTVTGSTVNTDEMEHEKWLVSLPDEVYEQIHGHGHSHVEMGTSPSGVDDDFRARIKPTLPADDYYIFIIVNRKMSININILDRKTGFIYENNDCTWGISFDANAEVGTNEQLDEVCKTMLKQHSYTYPSASKSNVTKLPFAKAAEEKKVGFEAAKKAENADKSIIPSASYRPGWHWSDVLHSWFPTEEAMNEAEDIYMRKYGMYYGRDW